MATSRADQVVTSSSKGYISSVLGSAVELVSETKSRASFYVSVMEHWIGHSFARPTQWLAMAAVSGLAISSAVAAKAGVLGPSYHEIEAAKQRERIRDEREATTQKSYEALLKKHNSMISASSLTEQEMIQLRTNHNQLTALHTSTVDGYEERIRSLSGKIEAFERRQAQAEELISASVVKITRLEDDLASAKDVHEKETRGANSEIKAVMNLVDMKTLDLETTQEELSQAVIKVTELQNVTEDFEARLTARDVEIKNLRDHQIRSDAKYSDSLEQVSRESAQKQVYIEELREARQKCETLLQDRYAELENLKSMLHQSQAGLETSSQDLTDLRMELSNMKSNHETVLSAKDADINGWILKHKDAEAKLRTQVAMGQEMQSSIIRHEEEVMRLKLANDNMSSRVSQFQQEIVQTTNRHKESTDKLQHELSSLTMEGKSQMSVKAEQIRELSTIRSELTNQLVGARAKVEVLQGEISEIKSHIATQTETHDQALADVLRAKAEAISEANSRSIEQNDLLAQLRIQLEELQEASRDQARRNENNISSLTNSHEKVLSDQRVSLETQISSLMSTQSIAKIELRDLQNQFDTLKTSSAEESSRAADSYRQELETWQSSYSSAKRNCDMAQTELMTVRTALEAEHEAQIRNMKILHESALQDISESHAQEVKYMQQALSTTRTALSQANADLQSSAESLQNLEKGRLELLQTSRTKVEALESQISEQGHMIALLQTQVRSSASEQSSFTDLKDNVESLRLRSPRYTSHDKGSPVRQPASTDSSNHLHTFSQGSNQNDHNVRKTPTGKPYTNNSYDQVSSRYASDSTSKQVSSADSKSRSLAYTSSSEGEMFQTQPTLKKENRVLGISENNFSRPSTSGSQSIRRIPSLTLTPSKTSLPIQPDVLDYVATGTTTPTSAFGEDYATPPKKSKGLKGLIRRTSQKLSRSPSMRNAPPSPVVPTHGQSHVENSPSSNTLSSAGEARLSAVGSLTRQISSTSLRKK